MKYNHIGIPTTERFDGEIDLPHLKATVSDHGNNPFGIQWQRYWEDAPYPEIVKNNASWLVGQIALVHPAAGRGPPVSLLGESQLQRRQHADRANQFLHVSK